MKMKSMKITKSDTEKSYPSVADVTKPRYPYGLALHLDKATIEKLGFKEMPEVGTEIEIMAKAKVSSISMNESSDGGNYKSMSLQITDMACEHEADDSDDAKEIYS